MSQTSSSDPSENLIKRVDYSQLEQQVTDANTTVIPTTDEQVYKNITENFAIKSTNSVSPTNTAPPNIAPMITPPTDDGVHAFATGIVNVPRVDVGEIIKKLLFALITGLPVLAVILAFAMFLIDNNFDVTQVSQFPGWTTYQIESFVKNTIIPNIQTNTQ